MSPSFTTVTMCSSCLLLYRLQCLVGLRQIYHNYDFGNSKVVNLLLAKHTYIYIYIYWMGCILVWQNAIHLPKFIPTTLPANMVFLN